MRLFYVLGLAAVLIAAETPPKKIGTTGSEAALVKTENAPKKLTQLQLLSLENADLKLRLLSADIQRVQKERMDLLTGICREAGFSIAECGIDAQAGTVVKREPEKK